MKRFILISILFLSLTPTIVKAQGLTPFKVDTVLYSEGKSADALFEATRLWLSTNVDLGSQNVTFSSDTDKKTYIGKAILKFMVNNLTWSAMSGVITCTYNIACRDGRVRFVVTDVVHDSSGHSGWDEGLIYEVIPDERNKGIGGKQHREVYKRVKKEVVEWFNTQCASLASYLNVNKSILYEDW